MLELNEITFSFRNSSQWTSNFICTVDPMSSKEYLLIRCLPHLWPLWYMQCGGIGHAHLHKSACISTSININHENIHPIVYNLLYTYIGFEYLHKHIYDFKQYDQCFPFKLDYRKDKCGFNFNFYIFLSSSTFVFYCWLECAIRAIH